MIRDLDKISDRDAVKAHFVRAADYVTLETGSFPNAATVDEFFADRPPMVDAKDARHLGVFEQDKLHGIVSLLFGYPDPDDCYIGLMLLSPDARGQGMGVRVLNHINNLAQARGAKRQLVAVLAANPKGRAFWEREGFNLEQTFPASDDSHIRHRLVREI